MNSAPVLHHVHKRKLKTKKVERSPRQDKWARFVDKFIYIVAIFGPLVTIPQLWNIWVIKEAAGVSMITWSGYLLGGFFYLDILN